MRYPVGNIFHLHIMHGIFKLFSLTPALMLSALILSGCVSGNKCAENGELKVCQFNMRYPVKNDGPQKDGSCVWEKRAPLISSLFKYHEVDVCGSQELNKKQIDDLMADLKEYAVFGTAVVPDNEKCHNNVIFYRKDRLELLDSGVFWLSETPEKMSSGWDSQGRKRNTNWGKFRDKKSGKTFYLFSSHFDHIGKTARIEAAKLLAKKIAEIAKGETFFAMGDYNSTPDSAAIAEIKKSGFMFDSYEHSLTVPYGPYRTFNNYLPDGNIKTRIDYIFTSQDVAVKKYAVISDTNGRVYPSDHYPIIIHSEIK